MLTQDQQKISSPSSKRVQVVDYKTCEFCGFRLVRVEPPLDREDPKPVEFCPICGMARDENGFRPGKNLTGEERWSAFDDWLERLGLSRDILRSRYRLQPENFFEE